MIRGVKMSLGEEKKTKILRKVVIVGEWGVGKTSLCRRYAHGYFDVEYKPTIGVDILTKPIPMGDKLIKLQIWDLGGQEKFKNLFIRHIRNIIRGAHGALAVFDVTNPDTLEKIPEWIDMLREEAYDKNIPIILVGNKIDMNDLRKVPESAGENAVKELNLSKYVETSAKTGYNVSEAFNMLINEMLKRTHKG